MDDVVQTLLTIRNSVANLYDVNGWHLDDAGCIAVEQLLGERGAKLLPGPVVSRAQLEHIDKTDPHALEAALSDLAAAGTGLAKRLTNDEADVVANLVGFGIGASFPSSEPPRTRIARAALERPSVVALALRAVEEQRTAPPDWAINGPTIGPASPHLTSVAPNVADDLRYLAGNPLGSVVFLIERAAGHSAEKAMTGARLLGPLDALLKAGGGPSVRLIDAAGPVANRPAVPTQPR